MKDYKLGCAERMEVESFSGPDGIPVCVFHAYALDQLIVRYILELL